MYRGVSIGGGRLYRGVSIGGERLYRGVYRGVPRGVGFLLKKITIEFEAESQH
ncbi:hypothetical protein [Fowl aviadenovirus E]|uniref:ORF34 n=1 Tax=Fowl adenovirus 8b TaxID=586029 RepID=A0A385Z8W3_9ADEN|nr:ORF34 [Fowl adenovirus 8b]WQM80146.1 hypothetical protein [Fowl adenovirus 8b]